MSQIIGKVGMTPRGMYERTRAYERLDVVTYQGSSWVAIVDVPAQISPALGSDYWQLQARMGETGPQGPVGPQGNSAFDGTGVELVNNLTQGGQTAALSAEQGKILKQELTELESEAMPLVGFADAANFEVGNIDFSKTPNWSYNDVTNRIRTIQGKEIYLRKGDTIVCNTKAQMYVGYERADGTRQTSGAWVREFIAQNDVKIYILAQYNTTAVVSNIADLLSNITITRPYSNQDMKKLCDKHENAISDIEFELGKVLNLSIDNNYATGYIPITLVKGKSYKLTNDDLAKSVMLYDANKAIVATIASSLPSKASIVFSAPANVAYIGGYVPANGYALQLEMADNIKADLSEIKKEVEQANVQVSNKADKVLIDTNIEYADGYIHNNASAGIFASTTQQYSKPIAVHKGDIIDIRFAWTSGTCTVIAQTDINGSAYTQILSSGDMDAILGGKSAHYVAEQDMYIAVCGFKDSFYCAIERYSEYLVKDDARLFKSVNVSGDYNFLFSIVKGRRYKVVNKGQVAASCFTRVLEGGGNVEKIVSEQTNDGSIPSYLAPSIPCIFIAQENANYIGGYCSANANIEIEDLDTISAQLDRAKPKSCQPNIVFQCREGRVSSTQYPNQTKWGIAETARNEYDRVRFTVRVTTDGYYFCCHDAVINNLAMNSDGSAISASVSSDGKTLEELNSYDWGIKYGSRFKGMNVPMLEDNLRVAGMYNLGVTLELNWTPSDAQMAEIFGLCAKYSVDANLLIICNAATSFLKKFVELSPKISMFWGGTYDSFIANVEDIRKLKTSDNDVYICCYPFGAIPSAEYINAIHAEGFKIYYSDVFSWAKLVEVGFDKGIGIMECANIPFIKTSIAEHADSNL